MEKTAGILGLGSYLPRRVMTNRDWEELLGIPGFAARLGERTGIRERRIAAPEETTVDLAVAAAEAALEDAGIAARDLAEIIVATDTPEVFAPDTSAYVQHRLSAKPIPAYELKGSGCAGFLQGLELARSRVRDGHAPVLIVGVELISRVVDQHDPRIAPLFGDGAAAAVVGFTERLQILEVFNATDGRYADALSLEVGGTRKPVTPERVARGEHKRVVLQGEVVFRNAIRRMTEAGRLILERAGVSPKQLALLITGQANVHIIQAVAENLGVPLERAAINLDRYADTGSAALPLALEEALREGRLKRGDYVLLTAFGAGFHWGAALLKV